MNRSHMSRKAFRFLYLSKEKVHEGVYRGYSDLIIHSAVSLSLSLALQSKCCLPSCSYTHTDHAHMFFNSLSYLWEREP